ncbi:Polycomb complex protein BMI-1 [Amphibalanus amphitrite]|uniref:Polycomb complex protein BMI-1 n=1 Tax=Amphibalanus amphitrite TaxID=1232801 RepID=A0A6A4WKN3_AMPAM|nr:Polycomb complex protein BMI-1 [Amphibalanus amphitrite]
MLVYKMVPDLFSQEMQQRRDFYEQRPYADPELPSWAKGDEASYVPHVFTPDEPLQLRLAMFDAERDDEESPSTAGVPGGVPPVRYLRCQAGTPLTVLQKLIRNKYQLPPSIQVQLISGRHVLPDDVTLLDLGYMGYLGQVSVSSPMSPHRPLPMSLPMPESASCYFPPGGLCSPPLHVDTSLASRLSYDMAMRNLLTLSHMAMAQGGMVRPPPHMFPTHPMFPPLPKGHEFHPMSDPSLLRRQSEARMGASAKKASPTAGTTAPPLRTPTTLTSASIQHMEDLTRTVGKRKDSERHSVTLTPIPFKG